MQTKERVRNFMSGKGVDSSGRSLAGILAWQDDDLEFHHDFIQWLFPLEQPSGFNPDAPVMSRDEFRELGGDPAVLSGLRNALRRMLRFYGLQWRGNEIIKGDNWHERSANWALLPTHNDLRITRILHSLSLFGLNAEAAAFLKALESVIRERPPGGGQARTLEYWRRAVVVG